MLQPQQSALPHVESTSLEPAQQATVQFRNMAMWVLRVDALIKPFVPRLFWLEGICQVHCIIMEIDCRNM